MDEHSRKLLNACLAACLAAGLCLPCRPALAQSVGRAAAWSPPPSLSRPAVAPGSAQAGRQGGAQPPSMKKPDKVEAPPSRARRSYDRARDATYVNILVTLLARPAADAGAAGDAGKDKDKDNDKGKGKDKGVVAAPAFTEREVTLTFQLAYRGANTYDLIAAYLIVESTAPPEQGDKLAGAQRLEIKADPYEYAYERADYRTETVALAGAVTAGTPPVRREIAAFKLPVEDLPQIAGAGRLALKVGAEEFPVRSAQLSELRRALAAGVEE